MLTRKPGKDLHICRPQAARLGNSHSSRNLRPKIIVLFKKLRELHYKATNAMYCDDPGSGAPMYQ